MQKEEILELKEKIVKNIGFKELAERLEMPYFTLKNKLNGYSKIDDKLKAKIQLEIEKHATLNKNLFDGHFDQNVV